MENHSQKRTFFFLLPFLLFNERVQAIRSTATLYTNTGAVTNLHVPTKRTKLLVEGYCRPYHVHKYCTFFITNLVYFDFQYKGSTLPYNLSGKDLTYFDLTGCDFSFTDITDTRLMGAILADTTCDYRATFLSFFKKIKKHKFTSYQTHFAEDLSKIARVYGELIDEKKKAELLHIAWGLASTPLYKGFGFNQFYKKASYWSYKLFAFKNELDSPHARHLRCSFKKKLREQFELYCWTTQYPPENININIKPPHSDFERYLSSFQQGCIQNRVYALNRDYKEDIENSLECLMIAYPRLKVDVIKQEACNIAHALSKSYQLQKLSLLKHYLYWQDRCIPFIHLVEEIKKFKNGLIGFILVTLLICLVEGIFITITLSLNRYNGNQRKRFLTPADIMAGTFAFFWVLSLGWFFWDVDLRLLIRWRFFGNL